MKTISAKLEQDWQIKKEKWWVTNIKTQTRKTVWNLWLLKKWAGGIAQVVESLTSNTSNRENKKSKFTMHENQSHKNSQIKRIIGENNWKICYTYKLSWKTSNNFPKL
jgi:hypothetical protein